MHAQIAMFVVPVVCLVGWGYGHPFSLDMDPLLVVILALAILQTCEPRVQTNWLCRCLTTLALVGRTHCYVCKLRQIHAYAASPVHSSPP